MRRLWRSFRLAWQFFTIIPAPSVAVVTDDDVRRSALFLPVIGALLGLGFTGVSILLRHVLLTPAAMFVALTAYTVATGALHVDGLMDTADAIGSRKGRDDALAIMKDSRVGAMGAIAAVFLLCGKWLATSELPSSTLDLLWLVPMWSRLAMLWSMMISPAAKDSGLGSQFARRVDTRAVWLMSALTLGTSAVFSPIGLTACLFASSILVVGLFVPWMMRKFGGMTGDTYGALGELTEWVSWFVLAGYVALTVLA